MGAIAGVVVALAALAQGAVPERVADGTVVAQSPDGVRLDSVAYVVEREGGVVWMTIAGADGSALRLPASTVSALRAALAYHLPESPPAQSLALGLDRGALYVGFARSVSLPVLAVVLFLGAALVVLVVGLVRTVRRGRRVEPASTGTLPGRPSGREDGW